LSVLCPSHISEQKGSNLSLLREVGCPTGNSLSDGGGSVGHEPITEKAADWVSLSPRRESGMLELGSPPAGRESQDEAGR